MFDFVAVSGTMEDRAIEHVDHLHEHFTEPVVTRSARYVAPTGAGAGARMLAETVRRYEFPDGEEWRSTSTLIGTT
jgi:L-fuconate dehydratase